MRDDYYQLLDVAPNANARELKAAYYRQAKRFHPDLHAGNTAAEERFKLVAEAYRVLGVPERRAEYDAWLHLHDRYRSAPELAAFAAGHRVSPFRYSARRAQAREARRSGVAEGRGRGRRRVGGVLNRRSVRMNGWLFLGCYALVLFNLVPVFWRHVVDTPAPAGRKTVAAEAASPSEAEVRQRLLAMEASLRERAAAGEAAAQYELGVYLFHKASRGRGEGENPGLLRRAASEGYRAEALQWWERAAAQGHAGALRRLRQQRRRM